MSRSVERREGTRRSRSPPSTRGRQDPKQNNDDDGGWGGGPVEPKKIESVPSRDPWSDDPRGKSRGRSRRSRSRSRSPRRRVSPTQHRQPRDRSPYQSHPEPRRSSSFTLPTRPRSPPPPLTASRPSRMDQSTSSESGYDGRGLRSAWDDDRVGRARTQPVTTRRDGGWESRRSRSPSRGPLESSKNIGDDDDGGWGGAPVETKKVEPRMSVVPRGSQGAEARWTSSERSRRSRSRSRSPRRGVSLIEDRRARDSTSTHYQPDDRRPSSSTLPTRARSPPPRLWDSTSTGSGLFGKGMRSAWDDNDAYGLRRSRSPSPRGRQAPKQDVVKKDDDGGWGYVESTDVEETETRRSRSSASRNPPANTNQDRVPSPLIASPSVGIEPKMLSSGSGSGTLSDANGSSGYQSHSRSPTRSLESNSKPTDAKSEPTSVVSTPAEPPPRARYRRVSPPSPPRAGSRPAAPPPPPFLPPPPLPPASPLYPTRPTLPATSCSPQQERKLTETIRSMDDGGEPHRPSTAAPVFSRPSIPSHSPPAASALARSPSQISSHSTQASRRREATSPLYLSASQSVDSGRGRTERTASIGASPSIRGRSETTDLFRDDGWGLREENEDGSARGEVEEEGEEEVIDLTGSPSTPPAARPPSPTWNSPSPGSSPPSPAEEAEDVVAVKEELEPSSSKAGRVSSPAKSEQSGSSRKRPGDDEGQCASRALYKSTDG
ncbi:hypothetical protein BDY24DRAFT_66476 [Mrakia frigida]|uniref:uncharacterized protein n=1 Tax=Mrakia frigida TaxID=29902 RepID=UPI003FCC02FA